jgi:ATP-dependent Lon protease
VAEPSTPQNLPTSLEAVFPTTLPLLLLTRQIVFPMSAFPLRVTNAPDVKLIEETAIGPKQIALVARRPDADDSQGLDGAYEVGCVARILQLQRLPDGSMNVVLQATDRIRLVGLEQREPYRIVRIERVEEPPFREESVAPLVTAVKMQMSRLIALTPDIPDAAMQVIENIEDPGFLADLIAANLNISFEEKQRILETADRIKRLERLTYLLGREVDLLEVSDKIRQDVRSSIDKSQREYFLRQQLKAIRDELGETDAAGSQVEEYRKRIEAIGLNEEVKKEALRELDRLAHMNEASAEYHVITSYLDWIVELPWTISTADNLDIGRAEAILHKDHYGLEKVKRRILEYLAVRKLKRDAAGPILCFVGPPGVGKTSLGKSIARALGRKFVRISLGGMRDEAEIRGHRKTYVGALPGRIIQNIRRAQSNNPVFMLDEIDKVGSDFRGDPSSALLEVLDPAQNNTFSDLYLNVAFDLSKVMFIATANVLDTIPWALRDRMEVIEIPGYSLEEKLNIARKYLVPRQVEAHGLTKAKVRISRRVLREIIEAYTREAGVRNLEREIANVCRACAKQFAEGRRKPVAVRLRDLTTFLGHPRVFPDLAERTRLPGVAIGLAWTATGGDILYVEATKMPGKGNLVLTGQLGDIMKESAQAVMSYVRANGGSFGIDGEDLGKSDIHIHIPAGAVPKDGPSAGVTILTAVASLLTRRRVKHGLAMTGEITLRGMVLPVGGIKEKVLAAARSGVKEVILPYRCKDDVTEVPESARSRLTFHYVKRMDEVLAIALELPERAPGNGRARSASRRRAARSAGRATRRSG